MKTLCKFSEAFRGTKRLSYLDHVSEKNLPRDELQFADDYFVSKSFCQQQSESTSAKKSLPAFTGIAIWKIGIFEYTARWPRYWSISAAFSFYKNPDIFDPEKTS